MHEGMVHITILHEEWIVLDAPSGGCFTKVLSRTLLQVGLENYGEPQIIALIALNSLKIKYIKSEKSSILDFL